MSGYASHGPVCFLEGEAIPLQRIAGPGMESGRELVPSVAFRDRMTTQLQLSLPVGQGGELALPTSR